jgi:hypothetical protein
MQVAVLGIDLGKNSCSVVGLDGTGQVVLRRRLRRESVITLASGLVPCLVAMEGLLRCAPPWPYPARNGAPGPADVAGIRSAVREGSKE